MNRIPLRLGIAVVASRTIRSVGDPTIIKGTHGAVVSPVRNALASDAVFDVCFWINGKLVLLALTHSDVHRRLTSS